ncbi:MAG: transcriptional regulator [Ignavibacteria bacterium RIFOXYB2_FULL_35_12]|nr:MAG: transcriptional regulator [Ignavibacteria bacterium GWC2_35_8]OGU61830.1 MAG: transcriptional regulator [Ignavibacteria bacterium GWF2_35_20]OGU79639.1 MAG: transcriptional regulator [Ignavibacteria bacterium RIFOXYA2_FULL_35_9]OGU88258.1 MAG: transcriptional regulator [Ignavibacteria bacterium RIFOXYA12_FULL_35_25]OGU91254.1 MAG: transcriptional regulator [Ignavibacteria bacterium RIFOXYC12_FULL_35_11]OGU93196.1 MAG: transcriptional regulator [Ignavibacteria bacterium RIFOXYB12_FULL_3
MKLEEEIKQKTFRNEYHKLAVNILYTHGWLINHHAAFLKKCGITAAQYNILRILRGQYPNPASVNLLKERMLDKMSDASRLVERLKQKELVDREICPEDRRRVEVVITKKGLKLLKDIDKLDDEADQIFNKLSASEAKTLNDLLDKMRG